MCMNPVLGTREMRIIRWINRHLSLCLRRTRCVRPSSSSMRSTVWLQSGRAARTRSTGEPRPPQGSYGHGKPGKVMEKTQSIKVLGKSWKCYIHMFIYAEFEIINMSFLKKDAQKTHNISKLFMFIPRFQFGLGNLVKSPGNPLLNMCKNPAPVLHVLQAHVWWLFWVECVTCTR